MQISKNCRTSPSRKVLKSIPICTLGVRNCTVICQAVSRTSPRSLSCLQDFGALLEEQSKEISTIAFVRALNVMLKNKSIKDRLVPIIADEARTFGMEGLFRQIGIYSPNGQQYTPQDREQVAYYKEDEKGQILQEGINELGAGCSWLAAATSYSTNNLPMIPFYIYYSMFGFQRIGDLCWAAGDQQARGFLIGGTSGHYHLNGEGLQHEDGHSHSVADYPELYLLRPGLRLRSCCHHA